MVGVKGSNERTQGLTAMIQNRDRAPIRSVRESGDSRCPVRHGIDIVLHTQLATARNRDRTAPLAGIKQPSSGTFPPTRAKIVIGRAEWTVISLSRGYMCDGSGSDAAVESLSTLRFFRCLPYYFTQLRMVTSHIPPPLHPALEHPPIRHNRNRSHQFYPLLLIYAPPSDAKKTCFRWLFDAHFRSAAVRTHRPKYHHRLVSPPSHNTPV